jgi:hypothetical protein
VEDVGRSDPIPAGSGAVDEAAVVVAVSTVICVAWGEEAVVSEVETISDPAAL